MLLSVGAFVGDAIGVPSLVGVTNTGRVTDRNINKELTMKGGPGKNVHDAVFVFGVPAAVARGLHAGVRSGQFGDRDLEFRFVTGIFKGSAKGGLDCFVDTIGWTAAKLANDGVMHAEVKWVQALAA